MGSTRFPNKVMQPIGGRTVIELLLARLFRAEEIDQIVIATSDNPNNRSLIDHISELGYSYFVGSEDDVLDRFYQAAKAYDADVVVRITGDCPLIDPSLVDKVIRRLKDSNVDYCNITSPPSYPDGLDTEVFTYSALSTAAEKASTAFQREHVTPYLRENELFKRSVVTSEIDYSDRRWTVDEPEDLEVIKNVVQHFSPKIDFSFEEIIELELAQPDLFAINKHLVRNEGAKMSKGQKLWKRAKRVIPGGNMLLSKRSEMFLPEQWPSYFDRTEGCKVWDLDDNEYIDMSIMGIGTNTLGYSHEEVDEAVKKVVLDGNMSTFNCPEEVWLAEKLIELHPWADMARFARSGGEANAIAIRIARAASGKDNVAICGYHGWHDWYLSANLAEDSNLDGHLLPGLEPNGVPKNLRGTAHPFTFNNFSELEELVASKDIGVIKMEVRRNSPPENDFLSKVRTLATEKGIVLIFDECTSGFRQTFGGLHKLYDVEPDMAIFGKALGNGYAITGIIGRREIMDAAQSTFISSTFWTERIGPAAGLATLKVMEREKSWDIITKTGEDIAQIWKSLAEKYDLPLRVFGLPAMIKFAINSENALAYKTLITQEMLAKGFLAGNSVYVCTAHSQEILDEYTEALDPIFRIIRDCEDGRDVMDLLKGPICHSEFKRLN